MTAIAAILFLVSKGGNPILEIPSPVVLYRVDGDSKEWNHANEGLRKYANMSPANQKECLLDFLNRARANGPANRLSSFGAVYEWRPIYDLGKLDLIRIAMDRPVVLHKPSTMAFIQHSGEAIIGIQHVPGTNTVKEASFDLARPQALMDRKTWQKAKKLVSRGFFLVRKRAN